MAMIASGGDGDAQSFSSMCVMESEEFSFTRPLQWEATATKRLPSGSRHGSDSQWRRRTHLSDGDGFGPGRGGHGTDEGQDDSGGSALVEAVEPASPALRSKEDHQLQSPAHRALFQHSSLKDFRRGGSHPKQAHLARRSSAVSATQGPRRRAVSLESDLKTPSPDAVRRASQTIKLAQKANLQMPSLDVLPRAYWCALECERGGADATGVAGGAESEGLVK